MKEMMESTYGLWSPSDFSYRAVKFLTYPVKCLDIYGPQRMNPTDFGDSLIS